MSEIYTRLFTLAENLYTTGSPVIISAGALLKNNQTNTVLAQLKIKNISNLVIKAVTINVSSFDTAGKLLGDVTNYQYLDLQLERDGEFGENIPIVLPNNITRSFAVHIAEVVFSNNTIWQTSGELWESLDYPKSLLESLGNEALFTQYRLNYGNQCEFVQKEEKDLWHCTCGSINQEKEVSCHTCSLELFVLKSVDFKALNKVIEQKFHKEAQIKKNAEEKRAKELEKNRKITFIVASVIAICIALTMIYSEVISPSIKYAKAVSLMENGDKLEATQLFWLLQDYKDSKEYITYGNLIAASPRHTVGLQIDGTVVAVGDNNNGQLETTDWTDIIAISAGFSHTVGLRMDGTVVAVGDNKSRQLDTSTWTDIIAISAGNSHTVGLRADGTVVVASNNNDKQLEISNWTDIMAILAGERATVGLRVDGTVVAVGDNYSGQLEISDWTDIIAISASYIHTVGLQADGTVVTTGDNQYGQLDTDDWNLF